MFRQLLPYVRLMTPWTWLLGMGIALQLMALASSIGLMALSGWFLSASALAGLSIATAHTFNYLLPSAGVRFFALSRTGARYGERLVTHDATFRLLSRLRKHVYESLEPLSPAQLQRHGESELMTRLTADVDALDGLYLRVLAPSIVALLGIVICGVVIGVFAPAIGLFAALALLLSGLLGPWLAWRAGQAHSDAWHQDNTRLRARLLERLNGLSELMIYNRWHGEVDSLIEGQQTRDAHEYQLARQWGSSQLLSQTLLGLTLTGVLGMAGWAVTRHELDATLVALMGLAIMGAFEAIALLPQAWQNLGRIQRAATRLDDVRQRVSETDFPAESEQCLPEGHRLSIDQLSVHLEASIAVLYSVSLEVEEGEHLLILGPSGSGKTTLFNSLIRFVSPSEGTMTLGGAPLNQLSEATLRAQFAVAQQETHLFAASYRDNLTMGQPIDDETIMAMLDTLALRDWLEQQPDGLSGFPDERGSSLSGGQLRRFGIARALLRKAPIVLLDEPTEGLDEATEQQVWHAIRNHCQGRTLIVITHRLIQLEDFDRIAMLDEGHLVEYDTPRRLLADPDSRLTVLCQRIDPELAGLMRPA
ncbi:thiol reductant ABC exporter subunit CydC [Kushneria phyllosphaerae]|uniref:Putative ABC transporter ATP-binding protein HI_0664 n=1 Tax=Kushneria phyllosphaerae TaxID=2100822 RepID=A0A2R8CKG9_9GAMM|nr:thiol reductant ABC exporter subunit CydC [Kushneria phyllosphaerae]SPJ33398.1 putative ABC transporter ATP-binding protein HI_0664 [Kushneria phyllosphaerae]